jgi:hypothetical protein
VGYLVTNDPPDSFYRIKFGRIGWQKDEYQPLPIRLEELLEIFGSMPSGIVQNQPDFAIGRLEYKTDKIAECLSTESRSFLSHKLTGFEIECSEKAHFVTD